MRRHGLVCRYFVLKVAMAVVLFALHLAAANIPSLTALEYSRAHTKLSELHEDNARWPDLHPNGAVSRAETALIEAREAMSAEDDKRETGGKSETKRKSKVCFARRFSDAVLRGVFGMAW